MSVSNRNRNNPFVPGNQLWKRRQSTGYAPKFDTPEEMIEACCEYFEWAENNPLFEAKPFAYEGVVTVEPIAKARVFTLTALCAYIGITLPTWGNWRRDRPEFKEAIAWVESIIYSNKFEGASAGLYNSNIIARDLGLADKTDLMSSDGTMTPKPALDTSKLSTDALAEIMAAADATDKSGPAGR